MLVSIVNDSQSHLNTRAAAPENRTADAIRGMEGSRARSDTTRYSRFPTGWGKAEQIKTSAGAAAGRLRTMDTQVRTVAYQIQRMSGDIRTFRKNFPPFPRGSEERERLLNSFQGIRKQIERLTLPPKKDADPTFQGDGISQSNPSNSLVARFEKLLKTISMYLPDIPKDPSDADLQELEEKLEQLLDVISQQRTELVAFRKYYESGDNTKVAVQMTFSSMTLGRTFADQADWQMTVSQTRLKVLQA